LWISGAKKENKKKFYRGDTFNLWGINRWTLSRI